MDDVVKQILIGAAGDGSGGLVATFVTALLQTAGRLVRERFRMPERTRALQRAVAVAFAEALDAWAITTDEADHYGSLFRNWLLNPTVLSEFRALLTPGDNSVLDIDLLRAEFEDAGLSVDYLGVVSFETLLQDMVGTFYQAAAEEPALQEPMKIDLLRQMAQRMGALDRQMRHQTTATERAVDQLAEIQRLSEEQVRGQDNTNALLQQIRQVLSEVTQHGSASQRIAVYQQSELALTRAGLLSEPIQSSVTTGERALTLPAMQPILTMLHQIHTQLTTGDGQPDADTLAALEAHYCQMLVEQFKHLAFEGLQPSGVPIVLPLAEVYVELKAVADVPEAADAYSAEERRLLFEAEERGLQTREEVAVHLDALRAERWNRLSRQHVDRLQRRSIEELLRNPMHHGVVILGDPGSGKTTLLRYQALCAAQRNGHDCSVPASLPIFVPLAAYDAYLHGTVQRGSLGDFLATYYDRWHSLPGLAPLFRHALEEGRAHVLLDGLDEVLDTATRQFVAEQAAALIRQWAPRGNRFAITSRIIGYREARLPGDLPHVTVLDFGPTEIAHFAHKWCHAYEVWVAGSETPTALQRAALEEQALLDDVRSNSSVERLAASPLLLTMLALLRRHVGQLPDRRIDLYASYVRTLIDNWQLVRSRGARQQMPERIDFHTAIDHLIELAFWLQQHKPSGTAPRQELEQVLETICLRYEGHEPAAASPRERVQARQTAERFLRDMRYFAGLLAERGRDAFGFLHLTFQEYFAGRALARMDPEQRWETIAPNLHRPRWREPILLCAGQLGVLERRREVVSDLAHRILTANSANEGILHRDLFLTAALAADNVGLSSLLLDELASRLQSLQHSAIPTVRDTVLTGLAQLGRLDHVHALSILTASLQQPELQVHVMRALKTVIATEACIPLRQAIFDKLADEQGVVRRAAVQALSGLVGTDATVRQAIFDKLADEWWDVRRAAVQALSGLVNSGDVITQRLLPWLGTISEQDDDDAYKTRHLLATTYAPLLVQHPSLLVQVTDMLTSPAWPARQGAALALIGMPDGPPPHIRPALLGVLDDTRGEESWPERLQACEILLNDRDRDLSQRAIDLTLEALDYATQPWYDLPYTGARVRQEAARILGQLEPLYRDERIFARLVRVLQDDADADVRDAAYGALLRLAAAPEELSWDTAPRVALEIVQGGSMLLNTLEEFVLRVSNHGSATVPILDVKIMESAEYDVDSPNPVILTSLIPQIPQVATFRIRAKVTRRLTLNYRINGELREPPLYINVIRDNPYVYGDPIRSDEAFFGRQRELEDIIQAVSKPNKQDVMLVGERRTGKSSLLYQLQARLYRPFVPVYVVLNEAAAQVDAIIALMCTKLRQCLIDHGILVADPYKHDQYASDNLTDNLKTILDAVHREAPEVKIVLLLDEADYILQVDDRLQHVMRAAFQSREVGDDVRVVVAGTTDLSTYMSQRSSPFFNHFRFVPLKPLSKPETYTLITEPAAQMHYSYEPQALEQLYRASGGHPYYCQRLCYETFTLAVQAQEQQITTAYTEAADQKVMQDADAYRSFVTSFWQPSPPREPMTRPEKQFLTALARGKSTAKFSRQTVQRCLDWQLVVEGDDGYAFSCELFRAWTQRASGG